MLSLMFRHMWYEIPDQLSEDIRFELDYWAANLWRHYVEFRHGRWVSCKQDLNRFDILHCTHMTKFRISLMAIWYRLFLNMLWVWIWLSYSNLQWVMILVKFAMVFWTIVITDYLCTNALTIMLVSLLNQMQIMATSLFQIYHVFSQSFQTCHINRVLAIYVNHYSVQW